jgi:16S rRNA processing protein RimM
VLLERDGVRREAEVVSAAPHGRGLVLLELAGVNDRTAAEAMVGTRLLVRRADLPPPAEDEFYHHDLIGFDVETSGGERLGTIAETLPTGLNDVWVVREGEREHLIPVIADVVRVIDRAARRVVIEPLPGLLD